MKELNQTSLPCNRSSSFGAAAAAFRMERKLLSNSSRLFEVCCIEKVPEVTVETSIIKPKDLKALWKGGALSPVAAYSTPSNLNNDSTYHPTLSASSCVHSTVKSSKKLVQVMSKPYVPMYAMLQATLRKLVTLPEAPNGSA